MTTGLFSTRQRDPVVHHGLSKQRVVRAVNGRAKARRYKALMDDNGWSLSELSRQINLSRGAIKRTLDKWGDPK